MQTTLRKFFNSFFFNNLSEKSLLNGFGSRYCKAKLLLQYISFSALFLGMRLWLIKTYGNGTPFYDQWDAEAATLYKPLFDGTLTWQQFFANHNEHRILTTRLLALALFYLDRTWNPILQMVVNAGLHLMAILLLNALVIKITGRNNTPAILAFSLILFSIPYGWENILVGFQGQFYFVLLFSIASLWFMITNEPLSKRWWAGLAFGVLAYLSLASGLFAFSTSAFFGLLVYFLKLRKTNKQLIAVAIPAALFLTGVLLTPSLEHQNVLKAHSVFDLYHALKIVLGWPVGWNSLSVVIRNFPIAIFIAFILWKRPATTDARWFLFALCVWSLTQAISIAYGRAVGPMAPRYKDLHIIPIFINFICCISLTQSSIGKWRNYAITGLVAWMVIVLTSIGLNSFHELPGELAIKLKWSLAEEKNTKKYLATSDAKYFRNQPDMEIPYPNPDKLVYVIELPGIREILPSNIREPLRTVGTASDPDNSFIINGYNPATPKQPDTVWGSYNMNRDAAMGHLTLHYYMHSNVAKIEIPVAGYPLNKGTKLEIEQNGRRKPIVLKENPKERWELAYVKVGQGPFAICVTDSSTTGWLAIGAPNTKSRLEGRVNSLLDHYYMFIVIGLVAFVLVLSLTGMEMRLIN